MRMARLAAAFLILGICAPAFALPRQAEVARQVAAITHEWSEVEQHDAERIFATADAAIWFPESRSIRWLESSPHNDTVRAAAFAEQLDRDYPRFRDDAWGAFLLKLPLSSQRAPAASNAIPVDQATIFTESFENGMGNWTLDDNTLGLYSWGPTTCEARTGSRSADALRGGANTLTCTSAYASNVNTVMLHKGCEGIGGAASAWLDAWIHVDTETGWDTVAFYYAAADGRRHGYGFSGSWPAWFHVVMNLKQWYTVGDVTATACPALSLEFDSDESTESGFGVRVDDLTIGNSTPAFLAAAITANPSSGAAPLTVGFTPVVTGSSGGTTYSWTFGDSAGSTSTSRNPSFTYTAPGNYNVRLRLDEAGVRAYAHSIVRVSGTGTPAPARRRIVSPPSNSNELSKQTIGPGGGSVSGGGVTLTVPAGAFSASTTVTLSRVSANPAGGDLSPTFGLQGLPQTLAADLSLSIDLDSAPALSAGESLYISFGALAMDRDLNVRPVPFRLPATATGRTVKATLPKSWGSPALANASHAGGASVLVYTGDIRSEMKVVKRRPVTNAHFDISAAPDDYYWAQNALTTLEQAWQMLAAFGFSWGCRNPSGGTFVKIPVDVSSLGGGVYGTQESRLDPCGTAWVFTDYISLNRDQPVSSNEMQTAIAHELFHFLQDVYVPTTLLDPNKVLWLAEASSTWFETIFVPSACPPVMSEGFKFAWHGLMNTTGSAVEGSGRRLIQNHGYGASALLKYRTDSSAVQNDPFVRTIWENLKSGSGHLDAIQAAVGSSVPTFWNAFAKDFFEGKSPCVTIEAYGKLSDILNASSVAQSFSFGAYPLSAISWKISLQRFSGSEVTPATISAAGLTSGQSAYVYDVRSKSELAELTSSTTSYEITDLQSLKGSILVVVFVDRNLPTGTPTSPTNQVTMSIAPKSTLPACNGSSEANGTMPYWNTLDCKWENDGAVIFSLQLCLKFQDGVITGTPTCYSRAQTVNGSYDAQGNVTFAFEWKDWYNDSKSGYTVSGTFTGKFVKGCIYSGTVSGEAHAWNQSPMYCAAYDKKMTFTSPMKDKNLK